MGLAGACRRFPLHARVQSAVCDRRDDTLRVLDVPEMVPRLTENCTVSTTKQISSNATFLFERQHTSK